MAFQYLAITGHAVGVLGKTAVEWIRSPNLKVDYERTVPPEYIFQRPKWSQSTANPDACAWLDKDTIRDLLVSPHRGDPRSTEDILMGAKCNRISRELSECSVDQRHKIKVAISWKYPARRLHFP